MVLQVEIHREDTECGGRYIAKIAGAVGEGELSYRRSAPGVVIANHTGVPPTLQGQGIAAQLVEQLVAMLVLKDLRSCPPAPMSPRKSGGIRNGRGFLPSKQIQT